MEVNVITLENGCEYLIIDTIELNNKKYLFLSNEKDENDMCVRKVIIKEEKEFLVKLDNNEELENVLEEFSLKYRGENNEK